jgi:nucleotide-binding universal stress UspA family protein
MTKQFSHILCVLNDTNGHDELLEQAIHVAQTHQAKLTVLLVFNKLPGNANMIMELVSYTESNQSIEAAAKSWIKAQQQRWSKQYPVDVDVKIGHPYLQIIKFALAHHVDLVFKLSCKKAFKSFLNSDDMHLLRKCPCPVWIAHRGQSHHYGHVAAAIDVNYEGVKYEVAIRQELDKDILRQAITLAQLEQSQLHIIHVYDVNETSMFSAGFIEPETTHHAQNLTVIEQEREVLINAMLDDLTSEFGEEVIAGLKPQIHLVQGDASKEVVYLTQAENIDAIVMGTVARVDTPGFFVGYVAEEILQNINCSVLALKPKGFKTPIEAN